jgi:glycine cleavage system H protein
MLKEFKIGNDSYSIPADRHYGRENHMWAMFDTTNGQVLVGIDALGLTALGDLAYVTLQPAGTSVYSGKAFGTLEAAKMTGDLFAPISGTIVSRNDNAVRNPSLVNQDPYAAGWLISILPSDWQNESAQLVSGSDLPVWVETELERYRQQGWID